MNKMFELQIIKKESVKKRKSTNFSIQGTTFDIMSFIKLENHYTKNRLGCAAFGKVDGYEKKFGVSLQK